MKIRQIATGIVVLFAIVYALVQPTQATGPVNVIRNAWALGDDNADGCPGNINDSWNHNAQMSLSRCDKNPAPPDGLTRGGSAFKCGPTQGNCAANTLGESWQEFNPQERGVPYADEYEVSYSHLQVCVGCTFVHVELYGSADAQNWTDLATLLHFEPNQLAPCSTSTYWATYCGNAVIVPHYDHYKLVVSGMYHQQSGYKFTGVKLMFDPVIPQPTITPVATETPTATSTSVFIPTVTNTPDSLVPFNMQSGVVYKLVCNGSLVISGDTATCEG